MKRLLAALLIALALPALGARQFIYELRVEDLQLQGFNVCTDTASATSVDIGYSCNVVTFTGTTQVNTIEECDATRKGRPLYILCNSAVPFGDDTGSSPKIKLNAAFTCAADQFLVLMCDGTDWVETGRTATTASEVNNLETIATGIETTEIFVGNAPNAGVYTALSGDITMDNTGVCTIENNAVDGTDIAIGSDAIGDILYYDGTDYVVQATHAADTVLHGGGAGAPTFSTVASAAITDGTIVADDMDLTAAYAWTGTHTFAATIGDTLSTQWTISDVGVGQFQSLVGMGSGWSVDSDGNASFLTVTTTPQSVGTVTLNDLENSAAGSADISAGSITMNCTDTTMDAQVCDFDINAMGPTTPGSSSSVINFDGSGPLITMNYPMTAGDITINTNTISSAGASTLAITPTAGQVITFDGTVTLDAGVIAGATSITSTAFSGALTGNASTATALADGGTIPQGAAPTVDAVGEIAVDTTSDQLAYYGAAKRILRYEQTYCAVLEDLTTADDNYEIYMPNDAITVTAIGCRCRGTCTSTLAGISFEIRDGTAMATTGTMTCATTGAATFLAVDSGGDVAAGGGVAFDVDTDPTIQTDDYTVCFSWVYTAD